MKQLIGILLLFIVIACNDSNRTLNNFDWLIGKWERTNDSEEKQTYEFWKKVNDTEYRGLGFTLQNGDTVFKENIRIIKENEQWMFEVSGVNESATLFKLTQSDVSSFTAENPENPFPKKITYRKENDVLHATIADESNEVKFHFQKQP